MGTIKQRISWPHQSWPQKSHMKEMLLFPWWLTSEISRKFIIFANCVKIALKMKIWLVDLKSVTYSIFFVNTVNWRHLVIQFLTMFITYHPTPILQIEIHLLILTLTLRKYGQHVSISIQCAADLRSLFNRLIYQNSCTVSCLFKILSQFYPLCLHNTGIGKQPLL